MNVENYFKLKISVFNQLVAINKIKHLQNLYIIYPTERQVGEAMCIHLLVQKYVILNMNE